MLSFLIFYLSCIQMHSKCVQNINSLVFFALEMEKSKKKTKYSIEEVVNYYGIGWFTLRLMALLGLLCVGIGAISSTFANTLSLIWQCKYNIEMSPKITLLVIYGGMAFGSICYGWLADRCGRKLLITFTMGVCWYFSCLLVMSSSGTLLMLNLFMISTGFYGKHIMTNYSSEAFPKKYRPKLQTYLGLCVACGATVAPLIAFFAKVTSNQLILIISLPLTVCMFLPILLPESIAYLKITDNMNELLIVFKQLSKDHRKRPPKRCAIITRYMSARGNLSSIFQKGKVFNTLILTLLWCTGTLSLTASTMLQADILGGSFNCESYPRNTATITTSVCFLRDINIREYATSTYGAFADLCGLILCLLTIDVFSRRHWFIFALIATGIGFSLMNFCTRHVFHCAAMLITRGLSTALLQVLAVFTNEVYPTSIRCTVTGFYSFISSLFVIVVPLQLDLWEQLSPIALSNTYVVFCVVSCLLCPMLKEQDTRANQII